MSPPARIQRVLRAVERRVRTQRALETASTASLVALPCAALALLLVKTGHADPTLAAYLLGASASLPALASALAFSWPLDRLLAARRVDRACNLRSRMASAVEFAMLAPEERSPFMDAAIADAETHAGDVVPARVAPLERPRALAPAALSLGLTLLLAAFEVPVAVPVRAAAPPADPVLSHDDVEAFESDLERLADDPGTSQELRLLAGQLNSILEAMADHALDRTEALRRIADLENRLTAGREADAEALTEALREIGRRMDRSTLTRPASEALRDADAARAEAAMRELAETLRASSPSRAELERLRQALERAGRDDEAELRERFERERREVSRLLRRQEQSEASESQRRLLRRRQRQLERLEREHSDAEARQRRLERLRRDLQRAAEDLNRQRREQSAQDLQRAAEDLNRMAREQMSEEQRRQLEQQLRQLRETIRRQQQSGQGQQSRQGQGGGRGQRMQRFVLRARGQGDEGGYRLLTPGNSGQQGQGGRGQEGQGGRGQEGQPGQGAAGQGQQGRATGGPGGQGQGGAAPGQPGGSGARTLMLGQGGDGTLEIPGMGEQGAEAGGGQGGAPSGSGAGTDHDPLTLDDPSHLRSSTTDSRVQGQQGQGPSRSETILGAADRGFVSRDYGEVYTDYRDHAEEVLERDAIPGGYRFYVRRYFQLIRPREEPSE